MKLRLSWSPAVHDIAYGVAAMLALVTAAGAVVTWHLWQQAGHMQRHSTALRGRVQALAAAPPQQQAPRQVPSPADLSALRDRLRPIRSEHAARAWTTNDWLDLLARDMPASVQLTAFQHGPDLASVSFTARADDAAVLAGWLLHMEAHGGLAQVSVLRQDSHVRQGVPVVSMDIRIRR